MLGSGVSACLPERMKRRSFIASLVALCIPLPKKSSAAWEIPIPDRFKVRGPTIYRVNLADMDRATWAEIDRIIQHGQLQFGIPASAIAP